MAAPRRVVIEVARRRDPPRVERLRVLIEHEAEPDISYLEQDELEERRAAYMRKEFVLIGVRAEAEIVIEGTTQVLTSPGLGGIESDSGDEYIAEVAAEEYGALRAVLKAVGIPTTQLPREIDPAWYEWRT